MSQVISPALPGGTWPERHDTTRSPGREWWHYGRAQRWLVVSSPAALARAEARVTNAPQRAWATRAQPRFHGPAPRVEPPEAAPAALAGRATSWRSHQVETTWVIEHQRDAGTGRPPPTRPLTAMDWQRRVQARPAQARIAWRQHQGACVVIGTHSAASHVSDLQVRQADTAQNQGESGLRVLKAPAFFVAALFVKQPCRMPGLLMVMTFARLVYAVTQRRRRGPWVRHHDTIPPQITQPTERPTLRWVFPRLDGMHRVRVTVQDQAHDLLEGLTAGPMKVLRLCGEEVCQLDQIAPG